MKRGLFLFSICLCILVGSAALADTVTVTTSVPSEHSVVITALIMFAGIGCLIRGYCYRA